MKANDLYLKTCLLQAELVTKAYSSSFSRSLAFVDLSIRPAIYAIYGMVRLADEIVDTHFSGANARRELDLFEIDLQKAISEQYSSNPILYAFAWAAKKYDIPNEYIKSFFNSMRIDTEAHQYTQALYEEYIYGSAEVIGLMSLSVFCQGNKEQEKELSEGAKKLGSAFQKVNFLRDIQADWIERHRIYFPGVQTLPLSSQQKESIELDIQKEFDSAKRYVDDLPKSARRGVRIAYEYYYKLFSNIKHLRPEELSTRQSVSNVDKAILFAKAIFVRQ